MAISKAVWEIDPGITNLHVNTLCGIYSGYERTMTYFFFQDPVMDPSLFPPIRNNNVVWDRIRLVDADNITLFLEKLRKKNESLRPNKRPRLYEVDIYDNISATSAKVMKLAASDAKEIVSTIPSTLYWDTPEVSKLFKPRDGETVVDCLLRRDQLLASAAFGNDKLMTIVQVDDTDKLTNKQLLNLRLDCLVLKKSYEISLQRIIKLTWRKCINIAIKELEDSGIVHIH